MPVIMREDLNRPSRVELGVLVAREGKPEVGKKQSKKPRRPEGPPGSSGKRRSFAQRVGTRGENEFRTFAHKHGLIATKFEDDFGIDFMCHVDLDHKGRAASDIANSLVGACVRATTSRKGKVRLNLADARNLLNSRSPLIFILVKVIDDNTAMVRHRLVDEAFSDELQSFIEGETEHMDVYAADCSAEADFEKSLATAMSHGFNESMRIGLAERSLARILPTASVAIHRQPDGQLTLVSTVQYFDYFSTETEKQAKAVLHAAFGSLHNQDQRIAQLTPRPDVMKYLRNLPQPTVLSGFTEEAEVVLRATMMSGETADAPFAKRRIGTHFAYVHDGGVSLIISHSKNVDGTWVHETEVFVDPLIELPLEDLGELHHFLAHCGVGSRIHVVAEDGTVDGAGFSIDETFLPLQTVARFVQAWEVCSKIEGWPDRRVLLRDVADREVFYTLAGLAALATAPESVAKYSFYLAASDETRRPSDFVETSTTAHVPFIANLAADTLVVWLVVDSATLAYEGRVRGLRFGSVEGAWAEVRPLVRKTTVYPEMVTDASEPTTTYAPRLIEGRVPTELLDVGLGFEDVE